MVRPRQQVWEMPEAERVDDENQVSDVEDGPDAAHERGIEEWVEDDDEEEWAENDDMEEAEQRGGARIASLSAWRDRGMATAEYAIATLAACGFAGLLVALLRSSEVRGLLSGIIRRALSVG